VACLVGLNPMMIRKGRERSTRSASANLGREVRGHGLASNTHGSPVGVRIETYFGLSSGRRLVSKTGQQGSIP